MESIIQTGLRRRDYLEGTIPDIRTIFINFGKFLLSKGIESEGTLEDYEDFLNAWDKQKEEQRQDEHLEFICWICNNKNDDFPFMIIRGEEYERFKYSEEDYEMEMVLANGNEFYNKFKEITSIDLLDLSDNFVSMSYIDDNKNDIELIIVNKNGNNERFIIGV